MVILSLVSNKFVEYWKALQAKKKEEDCSSSHYFKNSRNELTQNPWYEKILSHFLRLLFYGKHERDTSLNATRLLNELC